MWIDDARQWLLRDESGSRIEQFLQIYWDDLTVFASSAEDRGQFSLRCSDCNQGVEGLMDTENLTRLKLFCKAGV